MRQDIGRMIAGISTGSEFQMGEHTPSILVGLAKSQNLQPCFYDGGAPIWIAECTHNQMAQLTNSAAVQRRAQHWPGGRNQQEVWFTGAALLLDNILFVETWRGAACQIYSYYSGTTLSTNTATAANATDFRYGAVTDALAEKDWTRVEPSYMESIPTTDPGDPAVAYLNRHAGVLWGAGALRSLRIPHELPVSRETTDHGARKEVVVSEIWGYDRVDNYDAAAPASATAGTGVYNDSSIIFCTYSPPVNLAA
jgi:hypothetical protein